MDVEHSASTATTSVDSDTKMAPDAQIDESREAGKDLEKSSDETNNGATTVTWDSPSDPLNPWNWPPSRKWINVLLISLQGTLSPICSTILALGAAQIASDFALADPYTPAVPVGLYVLGLGVGPLLLAPSSELFGRRVVYVASFAGFAALNAGCALAPNVAALSVLRLLAGIAGSAGPSLGGSSIGDMFSRETRGKAQALYGLGPTLGPVIGGVMGGFIVYGTRGWRWLMWVMVIAAGATLALVVPLQRETYGPYLLRQKARKLRHENPGKVYRTDFDLDAKGLYRRSLTRPVRLLIAAPICTCMSVYLALIYGILYLHIIAATLLFAPEPLYGLFSYRWTHGTTGLSFLGAGIGSLIGTAICARYLNRSYRRAAAAHERKTGVAAHLPEFRLPFMQAGMAIVPAGLIIFGWTADARTHWVAPLIGACLFGLGLLMGYITIHTYLVDAFERYAASALAAAILSRCVVSCVFTVMGFQLYRQLGYAWGSMLLAFFCIAMIPIPFVLQRYGPRLRQKQILS